jgi:CRISPR-associated protein Csm5
MKYRVTCLTPTLVGDGGRLAAIDYMVWKDHVNVLDQNRIFRLLSKGPRLDGYLAQLKRADKLDFASWGGFAQNFAGRRIPFENPAYTNYWNRASGEALVIPTFASGPSGQYLPGAPLKGALRTGMFVANWKPGMMQEVAQRLGGDRPARRPAEPLEDQALGSAGVNRMRLVSVGDSQPVGTDVFKVYLSRVSTLQQRGPGAYALGWKQSPRGAVDGARPDDSTPTFAEMAAPGATFSGDWTENAFLSQPDIRRFSRWPGNTDRGRLFDASNEYAAKLLNAHRQYADRAKLAHLEQQIGELESRLTQARESGGCLLNIGWGGGLLSKTAWLDTDDPEYRRALGALPFYARALNSPLPFPKTRRIIFLNNQPATLPGWVLLEVG